MDTIFDAILESEVPTTYIPRRMQTMAPVVIDNMSSITNWAANSGCTREVNTSQFVEGVSSVKVTSASGSVGDVRWTPAAPLDYSAAQQIAFWVYIHNAVSDLSTSSNILIRFFATADFTGYYTYTLPVGVYAANRWLRVVCPVGKFTTTGSPVGWNNITRVQLRFSAASGITASVSFDEISYNRGVKAGVMFRFDDGPVSQYNSVFPLFRSHNVRATLYIPNTYPGTGGYVTWDNLRSMQTAGWTIGNHADHTDLTTLNQAQQEAALTTCRDALIAQGLTGGRYVSYPLGNWNETTLLAMAAAGMLTGADNYAPSSLHNYISPLDWHLIGSAATDNTTAVATLTGYIDDAIAGGTVVGFHFHDIGGASDMSLANLTTLLEYVTARSSQIYPLTIQDFYRLNDGGIKIPRVS